MLKLQPNNVKTYKIILCQGFGDGLGLRTMDDNQPNCIILPLKFQALFFPLHASGWTNERVLLSRRKPVHCNASVLQKSEFHLLLLTPRNRDTIFSSGYHHFTSEISFLKSAKLQCQRWWYFLAKSFPKPKITLCDHTNPDLHNLQTFFRKKSPRKPKPGFHQAELYETTK